MGGYFDLDPIFSSSDFLLWIGRIIEILIGLLLPAIQHIR